MSHYGTDYVLREIPRQGDVAKGVEYGDGRGLFGAISENSEARPGNTDERAVFVDCGRLLPDFVEKN